MHIDPDQVEEQPEGEVNTKEKVFRTINIPSKHAQLEETRKLDKMQKYVLSLGLKFVKDIIKSRKGEN